MAAKTNYLENQMIDWFFRGQTFTPPANFHFALFTVAPTDAGVGTEVTGGRYARVSVARRLASVEGTNAPGSTTPSTGTTGTTSNNSVITFPAPTANWGSIVAMGVFDAATGGNLLLYGNLTQPKTVNNGDAAPSFPAAAFTYQEDN